MRCTSIPIPVDLATLTLRHPNPSLTLALNKQISVDLLPPSRRRKVTLAASKFGPTQGKTAQKWVADSIEAGNLYDDFKTDTLMEMQLTLFVECQLDDDTGKCKDLSEAIEALTTAVADRKNKPKTDECEPRPTLSLHHAPPAPYSPHRRNPPHPPRRVRRTDSPH